MDSLRVYFMTLSMSLYWDSLLSLRWKLALFHRSGCGLIICICCYCRTRSPLSIQFAFHTETRLLAQFGSVTSSCLLRVFPVSFVICYYSLMLVTCNSHRAQRFRLRGMKIELFMGAFGSSFNFFIQLQFDDSFTETTSYCFASSLL